MILSEQRRIDGIGFAIPINTAKTILEQLKENKKTKRGYIMQIVPLTDEYVQDLGLKNTEGALVGGIVEDSPAFKGGMQVGDVVLSINDQPVKSYNDLVEVVSKTPIGKSLKITVWRNRAKLSLFITVAERP